MNIIKHLVEKAKNGNESAYLEIFMHYQEDIYRMAFLYLNNPNDALDVVQDTAYQSFKAIKYLKEASYVKTWLIKIAINCSLNVLRKRKKVLPLRVEYEELGSEKLRFEDFTDLSLTLKELIEILDEGEKTIIFLRFYQDLTIREVAEILNIPLGSVKTILYRALKKLRENMKGDEDYERDQEANQSY